MRMMLASARVNFAVVALLLFPTPALYAKEAPQAWAAVCEISLAADFAERDAVPPVPREPDNRFQGWGPKPPRLEPVEAPAGCDEDQWREQRILAAIDRIVLMDLNYCHNNFPGWERPPSLRVRAKGRWCNPNGRGWRGLDCSNFTAWVYNYALGVSFTPSVGAQADGPKAPGHRIPEVSKRTIEANEQFLRPGDLLYFSGKKSRAIKHVAIWIGARVGIDFDKSRLTPYWQKQAEHGDYVIADSLGIGPAYRVFRGSYKRTFSHARRVLGE